MRNSAQIGIMQMSSLLIRLTDICGQNVEMIIYERVFQRSGIMYFVLFFIGQLVFWFNTTRWSTRSCYETH